MILKKKLRSIHMSRSDNIISYLMKITQIRYQLPAIGEKVEDAELVHVALNGFTKSWEPFFMRIFPQEHLPNWESLWKMILKKKLRSIHMSRSGNITSYLMKITQIRDQLPAIGEKVEDVELVNVALNGFTKSWELFFMRIFPQEHLPNWERLWDGCI